MMGLAVKPYIIGFFVIAALGFAGALYAMIYSDGKQAAFDEVDKQNDKAVSDADLAALGVADCNAARTDGKRVRFDFGSGKCVRSGEGR